MHNFKGGGNAYSWMAWVNVCFSTSAIKINIVPLQNLAFILFVFKREIQNLYFFRRSILQNLYFFSLLEVGPWI